MKIRRLVTASLAVVGALLLAAVLYLAFGDLSRHKPRLESLVSESLGRPFAIDGPFELEVLPAIYVRAQRVRLGNARWGTAPQMVEAGRFAAKVALWSLVSGPVDIRSLELRDVVVVLEKSPEGKANWAFGEVEAGDDVGPGDLELDELPAVVLNARLENVRVAYREPGRPERVARLETLTIDAGADGLIAFAGQGSLRFEASLPAIPLAMSANLAVSRAKLELTNLKGRLGRSAFSGHAAATLSGRRRIDAELASPVVDLTPLLARDRHGKPKPEKPAQKTFVFGEAPLPLDAPKDLDARVHLAVGELKLDTGALKEVDAVLMSAAQGKVALEARARGGVSGSLQVSATLAPQGEGAATLELKLAASELRTGVGASGAFEPRETPAVRVDADLRAAGRSARQMAAGASGRLLVALGTGKVRSDIAGLVGSDLLGELAGKLNPIAEQDPYTRLECVVARVEVVEGQATVEPLLMQSRKVTVVASGKVDLRTEKLQLNFNARPREGAGISAGMFTNPFIEVAGTLASPRLGASAKGVAAGAAAAATGGMSVLMQGLWDRLQGEQDLCQPTLEAAGAASK